MSNISTTLDILIQGDRLKIEALATTRDINEALLLVHGVMARALGAPDAKAPTNLECDMARSLADWRAPALAA